MWVDAWCLRGCWLELLICCWDVEDAGRWGLCSGLESRSCSYITGEGARDNRTRSHADMTCSHTPPPQKPCVCGCVCVCVCGCAAVTLQPQQGAWHVPAMTAVRPVEDYLVLLARERWRGLPKERASERPALDLFSVTSGHRNIDVVWRLPP